MTANNRVVEQRGLFVPLGLVPPDWWIKQALLMFDSITATVATTMACDDVNEEDPGWHGRGALFKWLFDRKLWKPYNVINSDAAYFASLYKEAHDLDEMLELDPGNKRLWPQQNEMSVRHAVTLGSSSTVRLVPASNGWWQFPLPADAPAESVGFLARELLLDGVIPIPADDVPFEAVVDFRTRYMSELIRLREEINRVVSGIRQEPNSLDSVYDAKQRMEDALADIVRAAHSRRIRLKSAGVTLVGIGVTASAALPSEFVELAFGGFGLAAVLALTSRIVRGPTPDFGPFGYVFRSQRCFA